MLVTDIAILCVSAALLQLEITASFPFSRNKRAACFKQDEQAAFEKAQTFCIEDTAKTIKQQNAADQDEFNKKYQRLLNYYHAEQSDNYVLDVEVHKAFTECFKNKAAELLGMAKKLDKFNKDYKTENLLHLLEKVNAPKCQAKTAAEDVLGADYVANLRKKWENLSFFRRGFDSLVAKAIGLLNRDYANCLKKIEGLTLPALLCVKGAEKAKIMEKLKCFTNSESWTPEGLKQMEGAKKPADSLIKLGEASKFLVNAFICTKIDTDKQDGRKKRSILGALKIGGTWTVGVFLGVVGVAGCAIGIMGFLAVVCGELSNGWCFLCGGIVGVVWGVLTGVCLLLFCVFGVPWQMLSTLLNRKNDEEVYYLKQAMDDMVDKVIGPLAVDPITEYRKP